MRRAWRSLLYIFSLSLKCEHFNAGGCSVFGTSIFGGINEKAISFLYTLPAAFAVRQPVLCAGVCRRGYVDGGKPHHRGRLQQNCRRQHGAGGSDVRRRGRRCNNQHKVDQAWDWLRRIWIAWAVINGIGAFIAYVAPLFQGLATIQS